MWTNHKRVESEPNCKWKDVDAAVWFHPPSIVRMKPEDTTKQSKKKKKSAGIVPELLWISSFNKVKCQWRVEEELRMEPWRHPAAEGLKLHATPAIIEGKNPDQDRPAFAAIVCRVFDRAEASSSVQSRSGWRGGAERIKRRAQAKKIK